MGEWISDRIGLLMFVGLILWTVVSFYVEQRGNKKANIKAKAEAEYLAWKKERGLG